MDFVAHSGDRPMQRQRTHNIPCIIIPIRNEAEKLPLVLNWLRHIGVVGASWTATILLTNGCTDDNATVNIVTRFLRLLGNVNEFDLSCLQATFHDPAINKKAKRVTTGPTGQAIYHIHTDTAGKANALAIANSLAVSIGHRIAICLDANTFPEPCAVLSLFQKARNEIWSKKGARVISGHYRNFLVSEHYRALKSSATGLIPSYFENSKCVVIGALMSWDAYWLEGVGGIPQVATEDLALGLLSLKEKHGPQRVNATTWRFPSSSIIERRTQLARYVRGGLQICSLYPQLKELCSEEVFFMRSFEKMTVRLEEWGDDCKLKSLHVRQVTRAWEDALNEGTKEHLKKTYDQHW